MNLGFVASLFAIAFIPGASERSKFWTFIFLALGSMLL